MPHDRPGPPRDSRLAFVLLACAGALTGLALARPTPMTVANAMLFWAWSATALRFAWAKVGHRVCAACGAIDPLRLPDGSCGACAAPLRRSFPELAQAAQAEEQSRKDRKHEDGPSTSW